MAASVMRCAMCRTAAATCKAEHDEVFMPFCDEACSEAFCDMFVQEIGPRRGSKVERKGKVKAARTDDPMVQGSEQLFGNWSKLPTDLRLFILGDAPLVTFFNAVRANKVIADAVRNNRRAIYTYLLQRVAPVFGFPSVLVIPHAPDVQLRETLALRDVLILERRQDTSSSPSNTNAYQQSLLAAEGQIISKSGQEHLVTGVLPFRAQSLGVKNVLVFAAAESLDTKPNNFDVARLGGSLAQLRAALLSGAANNSSNNRLLAIDLAERLTFQSYGGAYAPVHYNGLWQLRDPSRFIIDTSDHYPELKRINYEQVVLMDRLLFLVTRGIARIIEEPRSGALPGQQGLEERRQLVVEALRKVAAEFGDFMAVFTIRSKIITTGYSDHSTGARGSGTMMNSVLEIEGCQLFIDHLMEAPALWWFESVEYLFEEPQNGPRVITFDGEQRDQLMEILATARGNHEQLMKEGPTRTRSVRRTFHTRAALHRIRPTYALRLVIRRQITTIVIVNRANVFVCGRLGGPPTIASDVPDLKIYSAYSPLDRQQQQSSDLFTVDARRYVTVEGRPAEQYDSGFRIAFKEVIASLALSPENCDFLGIDQELVTFDPEGVLFTGRRIDWELNLTKEVNIKPESLEVTSDATVLVDGRNMAVLALNWTVQHKRDIIPQWYEHTLVVERGKTSIATQIQ